MAVKLRKRKNNDGTTSQLLDIYHNGKRWYEFLKELKLQKASTPLIRKENNERIRLAEQIKNKREQELQAGEYDVTPAFKQQINFIEFFQSYITSYTKKDIRVMKACLSKFKEFMKENGITSLTTKQVNEELVNDFREFLYSTLNGETPGNYFKRFKKVLKAGVRKKIFKYSPAQDMKAETNEGSIKKEILNFEEIQLLASTSCGNIEVKRAFLFSCYTGLRYCDIIALTWSALNGNVLKVKQQKTGNEVEINLNTTALQILGKKATSDEFIFNLPSHTACLKNLRLWCRKAGIEKKITWHCARHSFGTNILFYGANVKDASELLGHTSLAYTNRYLRKVEAMKQKAVENLPAIQL